MICLRCNSENDDLNTVCSTCGADMYINTKTRAIAVKLFNKGLAFAKERKLKDAVDALNRSLYFDRFNIDALNVLGLVYFELGMIADALCQWAISASYFSENNLAKLYLARIKDNVREMEKMNDATKMYNQGLVNIINKNDDVAVIQLKKAIELNPKLVEAKNLLTLIYVTTNTNTQQALSIAEAVREHDTGDTKALLYKDCLSPKIVAPPIQRHKQTQKFEQMAKQQDPYLQKKVKRFGRFPFSEMVSLIIGAGSAVAAMYYLVIPSIESRGELELARQQSAMVSMQQQHESVITGKEAEIAELTEKNAELLQINTETNQRTVLLEKQQKIMTAVSLSAAGSIRESAAIIKDLDIEGLGDAEMSQYNAVKEAVFPQMAKLYFDEGRREYNARNYDEAQTVFLAGLEYGMTVSNSGDAYYYLGRIAETLEDTENAKKYYEKTINEFSACTQFYNASNRLRALNR